MVAGVRCSEAADTKALVHGGCATACSVCPHLLLYFFGYETNLFDIAVYLLAALKHRLIRRASRDTSGAAVASVSRLSIYLNRPVWIHLRDRGFFSAVGKVTLWKRIVHEAVLLR